MIHPSSDVQSTNIGSNTSIWQFCVVLSGSIIGDDCNINANVFIENDVVVGNRVTVKSGVQLWDGIKIEDDVFVGPNVTFTNDNKPRSKQYPQSFGQTVVRKGASIGANSTILPNIEIGEFALIGAGSVVTKKVLPQELVIGNPAKRIGWVNKKGDKLIKLDDNIWNDEFSGEIFEETSQGLIKR
jgi:UDP-2-acetamido-3-amino-2,3-dideoxy-glucuronate N-acetyltransferase